MITYFWIENNKVEFGYTTASILAEIRVYKPVFLVIWE